MADTAQRSQGCGRCQQAQSSSTKAAMATSGTSIITAALALLPSFTCPACIAAYAGVLSAAGFGFLLRESVLRPLVAVFLVVNLLTLGWTARSHRSPGPMIVALIATACVVTGRFALDLPWLLYTGAAGLFGAAMWNLWLKRPRAQRHVVAEAS